MAVQAEVVEASKKALQGCMGKTAEFGKMVMEQLVHNHPSPSQNGSGNSRCARVLSSLNFLLCAGSPANTDLLLEAVQAMFCSWCVALPANQTCRYDPAAALLTCCYSM